ncbi:MAG: hypothetical protein BWY66_00116 [bacterium ADurb.Bin374]|nr:MAG: hypothetical protein BWY66_00116 [bacterium ADurb.Bin374]
MRRGKTLTKSLADGFDRDGGVRQAFDIIARDEGFIGRFSGKLPEKPVGIDPGDKRRRFVVAENLHACDVARVVEARHEIDGPRIPSRARRKKGAENGMPSHVSRVIHAFEPAGPVSRGSQSEPRRAERPGGRFPACRKIASGAGQGGRQGRHAGAVKPDESQQEKRHSGKDVMCLRSQNSSSSLLFRWYSEATP